MLSGKSEDFGILVEKYSEKLYRLCFSLCGNRADAEDAVQEAFFDAFRYLASLTDREKFYPWLCSVARRKTYRLIKQRRADSDIDEMAEFLSSDKNFTDDEAIREERRERVLRTLGKLPVKKRAVLEMFYFRDMKISEISKKLSLSESTVKSRLFDSREYLRKELYDMDENRENIKALEEKIKKQLKVLSYYYTLNGKKYDESFMTEIKKADDLIKKIDDEEAKQCFLSSVLAYQSFAQTDENERKALWDKSLEAAEKGRNAATIVDELINEFFKIHDDSAALKYLDETALPKIDEYKGTIHYNYAKGSLLFWRGRVLHMLDRKDEARKDFLEAAALIERFQAYQANAVAAIRTLDNLKKYACTRRGCTATAEGLLFNNGRLIFHNQPGFGDGLYITGVSLRYDEFVFFGAACNDILFDTNMKAGEKIIGKENDSTLECVSYDEKISVPAGDFEGCMHMRTDAKFTWTAHYILDIWYAPGVGIVKVESECNGAHEKYELYDYSIVGGEGYFPMAVGNQWAWRCPDVPGYVYHNIERSIEYTDDKLMNLAVSSQLTLSKDFENSPDVDSNVFITLADLLCDDWKIDEAIDTLKKAVRLNINEEAVRISLYAIEVLSRFADYQKIGYRFCPSHIGASSVTVGDGKVKYQIQNIADFGPYRLGARGRYEDRIFGMKPFRWLDQFMSCLWDEKWVPGYREEKPLDDDLKMIFTVEDGGSVTVPAGTFDNCRKVTIRVDKPEDADEWWYFKDGYANMSDGLKEYWFAPGVGIVKVASTWGSLCYAECLLKEYSVPASDSSEYFPIQIGNYWEYDEPHLTEEGYRAKAIFRIASGMNGKYLMTDSQEFIYLNTEEEYDKFKSTSYLY